MYQQPTESGFPSALENHRSSAYSLATLISSASILGAANLIYGSVISPDTTASGYGKNIFFFEGLDYQLGDLDDLIDEVGEAEDDRVTVGIEDEEYTSTASGEDILSWYLGSGDENYAALEPPSHEIYLNSLLDTEIDVARPYDSKSRRDGAGIPFYEVSYYDGQSVEEITEPEGERTELEAIFTASTTSAEDSEPDENVNPEGGDLESRLGFRKAA